MSIGIGLCSISKKDTDLDTLIEIASTVGFDGIEIWGKQAHVPDKSAVACRDIRLKMVDNGLQIPVYGSYLRAGTDRFQKLLKPEVAVAKHLGAEYIRVWAGTQEFDDCDDDHWETVVQDLKRLTNIATNAGVGVTIERHEGTLTDETQGSRQLIEAIDHDQCGLNYQPLFSMAAEDLHEEVASLAPLSNNIHLQAVPEPHSQTRCALSAAYFDVSTILGEFEDADFTVFANIEFVRNDIPYADALDTDIEFLRSILE